MTWTYTKVKGCEPWFNPVLKFQRSLKIKSEKHNAA